MRRIQWGKWGSDKTGHAAIGILIGCAAIWIGWWALLVVALTAVFKEVYDYFHPWDHSCEVLDALMTFAGGLVVTMLIYFIRETP